MIPIADDGVASRIHQNYHVAFLTDVVLPRALDDHTFAALNQITFVNNVQIVAYACNDGSYLPALKAKLDDASLDDEARLLAIRLLNELCGLAKQLQLYNRTQFYRRFLELGFFSPLAGCLLRPSQGLRLATLDVLVTTVHHEPSMLRGWILQQRLVRAPPRAAPLRRRRRRDGRRPQ